MSPLDVRPAGSPDAEFIRSCLTEHFTSTFVALHDELIDASALPNLIAWSGTTPAGLLSYRSALRPASAGNRDSASDDRAGRPAATEWEIVAIATDLPGRGVGTALIDALRDRARAARVPLLWLVTTNNNTNALRFYQRKGFDLVRIDRGAVDRARLRKPSMPTHVDGIPMRHEIELEMVVDPV